MSKKDEVVSKRAATIICIFLLADFCLIVYGAFSG